MVKVPSFSFQKAKKVIKQELGAKCNEIIDIVEESKDELVKRYSLYIKNYYKIYREKFSAIKNKINNFI